MIAEIGYVVAGFLAVVTWALFVRRIRTRSTVMARIEAVPGGLDMPVAAPATAAFPGWGSLPADLAAPLARWLFAAQRRQVSLWLRQAGAPADQADRVLGFKLALCTWGAIMGALFGPVICGILLLSAYFGTDHWLRQRGLGRRRALAAEAPNLLDLISTCLQGGMTAREVLCLAADVWPPGALRDELEILRRELTLRQPLKQALDGLVQRPMRRDCYLCAGADTDRSVGGVDGGRGTHAGARCSAVSPRRRRRNNPTSLKCGSRWFPSS